MGEAREGLWQWLLPLHCPPLLLCLLLTDCWFAGYSDNVDCTCPKEPDEPNQQEVAYRGLYPLSPLTFFLSNLVLGTWEGLRWNEGIAIKMQ